MKAANAHRTREELIKRLREHAAAQAARGEVLTSKWLQHHHAALYGALRAEFGGFLEARLAAGFAPPSRPRAWSEGRIINELRQIHRRGRVRITHTDLIAAGYQGLVCAIYIHIGSLPRARRLARLPRLGHRLAESFERWDEDRIIQEIRARHRNGEPLAKSKAPSKLVNAALRYCGSWEAAIETAGLDYDAIRQYRRVWTRETLLAHVRRMAGQRIEHSDGPGISELVGPVRGRLIECFGGLPNALRLAGIDPASVMQRLPQHRTEELIAAVRAALTAQGDLDTRQFFGTPLGREAVQRFRTQRAVLARVGLERSPRRKPIPPAEDIIAGLQARYQAGGVMTFQAVEREETPLLRAAMKRFGSWRTAMKAAGLGTLVGGRWVEKRART